MRPMAFMEEELPIRQASQVVDRDSKWLEMIGSMVRMFVNAQNPDHQDEHRAGIHTLLNEMREIQGSVHSTQQQLYNAAQKAKRYKNPIEMPDFPRPPMAYVRWPQATSAKQIKDNVPIFNSEDKKSNFRDTWRKLKQYGAVHYFTLESIPLPFHMWLKVRPPMS